MVLRQFTGRATSWVALFSFLVVLMASIASIGVAQTTFRKDKLVLKTASGEHVIAIEVAVTNEEKSLGLMYRTSVPPSTGMLFPYDKSHELTMWMRNTYASLDMIFIKSDGKVHRIEYSTEPMSERVISSGGSVLAVLELAAGEARRLGVKPGDLVEHATFRSNKR